MSKRKIVLSLLAHPDDAEFMCAGTLVLLSRKGWEVHIASMTPGDCGSVEFNREQISEIRCGEAAESARIIGGEYHCLECDDVFIMYDRPTLLAAIKLMREVRPAVVFAPSPSDYMIDHEITSAIAQAGCFACGMPNVQTDGAQAFEPIPYLYYVDAVEAKDRFGNEVAPKILVDISSVIDVKESMLCCHASQRNWLLAHHGIDEYVAMMKRFAQDRGCRIGAKYAEGFRQHLGHGFPQDDILKAELSSLVHTGRE